MTVIADSSFIYALYNVKDSLHRRARDFAQTSGDKTTIVPDVILPEVGYLFLRDLGYARRDFSVFRPSHCDYLELLP